MATIDPSNYSEEVIEHVYQPWNIEVKQYSDGGFFAKVTELPGCMTEADTAADVIDALEEARAEWISAALEMGQKIPQPLASTEYSGKIFVRTSPDLHRKVAEAAARQGVSMSQWVGELLATEVGLTQRRESGWQLTDPEALDVGHEDAGLLALMARFTGRTPRVSEVGEDQHGAKVFYSCLLEPRALPGRTWLLRCSCSADLPVEDDARTTP